jgi:hypothetical protein
MSEAPTADPQGVFLNVPFDSSYEPLFVALIGSLVSIGRKPRCVLELPELGQGRLNRLLELIECCPVSINDLSRVNTPVRLNMAFELGIAVAMRRFLPSHAFIVLEGKRFRLQKTLSDLNGIDPGIHNRSRAGIVSCVLSSLGNEIGNPSIQKVNRLVTELCKTAETLKNTHSRSSIYSRAIFGELVQVATLLATREGLILR